MQYLLEKIDVAMWFSEAVLKQLFYAALFIGIASIPLLLASIDKSNNSNREKEKDE